SHASPSDAVAQVPHAVLLCAVILLVRRDHGGPRGNRRLRIYLTSNFVQANRANARLSPSSHRRRRTGWPCLRRNVAARRKRAAHSREVRQRRRELAQTL